MRAPAPFGIFDQSNEIGGETKFMFQFPDHLIPVLDGDMADWDIVSDVYKIKAESMFNQFGALPVTTQQRVQVEHLGD